jgi:hypothetical protein
LKWFAAPEFALRVDAVQHRATAKQAIIGLKKRTNALAMDVALADTSADGLSNASAPTRSWTMRSHCALYPEIPKSSSHGATTWCSMMRTLDKHFGSRFGYASWLEGQASRALA